MMMLQLGTKIRTEGITSPATLGTVVAIMYGRFYQPFIIPSQVAMDCWDKHYPYWRNEPVYAILKQFSEIPLFPEQIERLKSKGLDVEERYSKADRMLSFYPASEIEAFNWIEDLEKQITW
jgi:hypothetical protein